MSAYARTFKTLTALLAMSMALYHMFVVWFGAPEQHLFRALHLAFALTLTFLWYRRRSLTEDEEAMLAPSERGGYTAPHWADLLLIVAALVPLAHVFWNYSYFINRIYYVDDLSTFDIAMACTLIVVILEATRRLMGLALPLTALAFLVYALFIARVEPMRLLDQLYMTTEGIFGMPLGVSASYVMIFVLFGSFMERTGTGQLFMDFAMSLTGHTAGGPGKVSVISSSLFGTISGSAVANVMVDGPITIPLMKRTGFSPHFAAAVEAVASTGGQIMPPIMGAAAFVMAEFMGVSYWQIVLWATIPAILYYAACFASVHFEAKRAGLHGVPRADLPKLSKTLRERGHLFLPVMTILAVMWSGFSSPLAALAGTIACFPVALLRATTRANVTLQAIFDALVDGARNTLAVALACACAGIIIGVVTLTGLGITFTQFVVGLSQNSLLLALILTMMAGIVLGMGMPTTPAYIIMSALLIPALIKLGVDKPAANMFAFYFAILSAITPPVALAVYAAAGLAKSDIWRTGLSAVKVGSAGFVVPFMFVYEPALLMIGDWPSIIHASVTAFFGCVLLAAGLAGYLIAPANHIQRLLLVAGALALVTPGLISDLIGAGLCAVVAVWQLSQRKAIAASAATAAGRETGGG